MKKIRWGILSTAKIGREKVIPALQASAYGEVVAIASRDGARAKALADRMQIPLAFSSYEALLNEPTVDAVYIPLPNHLHVEWAVKAMQAGKHVLCEKPIGLNAAEALLLKDTAAGYPGIKLMEAFMYRFHPQWQRVKQLLEAGTIGVVRTIHSYFSYYNVDADNIRNSKAAGGGGLMDIGCYCISLSRFVTGKEPVRVSGIIEYDPVFETDCLTSGMLDFGGITATFTCSTQLVPWQRATIFGTGGRIEMELPFTPAPDKPAHTWLHTKTGIEEIEIDAADHYISQGDLFCLSIMNDLPVPTPVEDAVNNMKVIDAVFKSARSGQWVSP